MNKTSVNRASWFLHDGVYYHVINGVINFDDKASGLLRTELAHFDNTDTNLKTGVYDIFSEGSGLDSKLVDQVRARQDAINRAAWDEELARNGGEKKSPPPVGYTKDQVDAIVESMSGGPKRDVVSHYTVGEIETIDFIFDKLGYEGGMAYVIGNLIKYPSRANHKGCRRADITKIRNYATIALEHMDKNGELE